MKLFLSLIVSLIAFGGGALLFFISPAEAATICEVPRGISFESGLALPTIGGYQPDKSLPDFFVYFFLLAAGVAGFLALVMMVVAGVQYTTSGANPSAKKEAEERIYNALSGLALILCSYVILSIINQSLIIFSPPELSSSRITVDNPALCPSTRNARFNPDPCTRKQSAVPENAMTSDKFSCSESSLACKSGQDCQLEKRYVGTSTTPVYDIYCCTR